MELPVRSSKVKDVQFQNEFANPKAGGAPVYYHLVTMENGDSGSVGAVHKLPAKFEKGALVTYTMDEKRKIKILTSDKDGKSYPNEYSSGTAPAKGPKKPVTAPAAVKRGPRPTPLDQASYLGYAWSYGKDLIIAGKTMADVEELEAVARFIYDKIGDMLSETINPPKPE